MADVRARPPAAAYAAARHRSVGSVSRRGLLASVLWLIFWANAGLIVWLWLRDGGVSNVHNLGDLNTTLGRITGLLGAYLLLIQVVLLARLPFLEPLIGFDRLTVWHRRNGKLCLYLILAHVVFVTIGYAMTDRISIQAEATTLLQSYPGMVTATIGTALLIVVVISSLVIVRRRLCFEAWYLVHLTAYAGIVLSWNHEIPTGNELAVNRTAAAYWTGLYFATLVLVVLFRVVQPILRSWWFQMRVVDVTTETENVVSLRITGRHLDRLGARAGQFFLWRFLTRGRWWESHPFSISAAPDGRTLRITVKDSGDFSGRIGEIPAGTRIIAEGPFGTFTAAARRHDRIALIAGGIGITPIRALLEELSGDLVLIYRVLSDGDIVFRDELDQLASDRGITVIYVVGDHRDPDCAHFMSPEHLRELTPDIADREVYICGPPAMADLIESSVRHAKVPRNHIHLERFAL